jgi:hypothetical protein
MGRPDFALLPADLPAALALQHGCEGLALHPEIYKEV